MPAAAPQMSAKGSFVYVVKQDSTAEQRPVTLGQRQGDLSRGRKGSTSRRTTSSINGQLRRAPRAAKSASKLQRSNHGDPRDQGQYRNEVMNLSEPFIRRPVMTAVLTALGDPVRQCWLLAACR